MYRLVLQNISTCLWNVQLSRRAHRERGAKLAGMHVSRDLPQTNAPLVGPMSRWRRENEVSEDFMVPKEGARAAAQQLLDICHLAVAQASSRLASRGVASAEALHAAAAHLLLTALVALGRLVAAESSLLGDEDLENVVVLVSNVLQQVRLFVKVNKLLPLGFHSGNQEQTHRRISTYVVAGLTSVVSTLCLHMGPRKAYTILTLIFCVCVFLVHITAPCKLAHGMR